MSKYQMSQSCFDLMKAHMKKLGFEVNDDSLYAMANMIKIVTDSMEFLDIDETYKINGFLVRRRVAGNVFESNTLFFDDVVVLQINESCEGAFITFVNVDAVTSDTVIKSLLYLTGTNI